MRICKDIEDIQSLVQDVKAEGKSIAFVPTMGNLHQGHLKLVETAKAKADFVVVSIFVNPIQFGPNEDFEAYPRTFEADCEKLMALKTGAVFLPSTDSLYPEGSESITQVTVPKLSENHCGAQRPGHFAGVATVVAKLFNIVAPDIAIFGEKDFQQVAVIKQMVNDLNMAIDIISHPTEREADGLALSSRNGYLSPQERETAPHLYAALETLKQDYNSGQYESLRSLEQNACHYLKEHKIKPEYISICDAETLEAASMPSENLVVLAAAYLGNTRLIDNIRLDGKR